LREIDQSLYVVPCRWNIMPTGESISEVFVLKNPPTLVVRSVSSQENNFGQSLPAILQEG
ncbi:MAG: hypothetical protein WA125_07160, partial [Desulfosporosinus sp.]